MLNDYIYRLYDRTYSRIADEYIKEELWLKESDYEVLPLNKYNGKIRDNLIYVIDTNTMIIYTDKFTKESGLMDFMLDRDRKDNMTLVKRGENKKAWVKI